MKKFLSLVLALILVMSMVAGMVSCDTSDDPSDTAQTEITELEEAKTSAKSALDSYVNAENYRDAEKTLLETTVTNGKTQIESANTTAEVTAALDSTKALIDAIKTDAVLTAEELVVAKNTAKTVLDGYVSAESYREAQKAALATAIANGKAAIDESADIAAVSTALNNAKAIIDAIKTDADLTSEELLAAKNTAKAELDVYVNSSDYRTEEQAFLASAIADGKNAIDSATDISAVNAALANAKAAINEIKTDAELTAEDLATAKTNAKSELESYVNAGDYRADQQALLASAIANGKVAIDGAADISAVSTALANAKAAIDEIKTDAELTAEELAVAKAEAKSALDVYVDLDDYRAEQQSAITTAIANGKISIDAAITKAGVTSALDSAKLAIDAIETDAEITAKEPTITTSFANGQVFTNTRATLDVVAKDASGKKLAYSKVTVTVNGEAATVNWDDTEKTSYNFVFVSGENTIVITATDGAYTKTATYTVTCNLQKATTVTVSIEAFSIGLGYIVAPFDFELNEANLSDMADTYGYNSADEFKEKISMAYVLDYVLKTNGLEMDYQGSLESSYNGFYMSSISGIANTAVAVPDELYAKLEENGYYPDECVYDEGTLCEFDVTWGSGWMYTVNNSYPNVPFCDYVPQDGDVMRVQFTLAYGSDIGSSMVGDLWFDAVDRDPLTKLIAKATEIGVDTEDAITVVSTFGITQDELDAACVELQAAINAAQ